MTEATERLARERVMHEMRRRQLTVARVTTVAPGMLRVTLAGEDLRGFVALGPTDHVKVFFPDPATGEIALPVMVDGRPRMPEHGTVISRDYTPVEFREGGDGRSPELDLDFYLHGGAEGAAHGGSHGDSEGGPAANWAAAAQPGDALVVAGPRGSLLAPLDAEAAILVADETALPSVARWLDALGEVPITGLFSVADAGTAAYLADREAPGRELRWFSGEDRDARIEEALRGLEIGARTFVFLAGEATAIVPLRRYLRRELGLPKQQVDAHGYWKRGEANLDHHAPLDPSDPD